MIKNRKLFYQSLDTHCSEIQDFVLKVYQQIGWAEFWNFEIRLGAMSFKILELGELWDGDLFNFMKYFFGYNFGFQNSVNVSYCVGDFNARWNLPKEQFDIISEKVNNRVLKIDFLGWSKSFLFSSQNIFLYRVSQKNSNFFTSTLLRSFKKWYCECKVSKDHLSQDFNTIVFWMAKKERKKFGFCF